MIRKDRNLLAENLRYYIMGTITNFEFINRMKPIYRTKDKGVRIIESEFWFCYDDLKEHRNIGKYKLSEETEKHIKRSILFLKSNNEYEWKDPKFPNPINWILNLISLRVYPKNSKEKEVENIELGDESVWPFFRKTEFDYEINNPIFLNKKTPPQQL